MGMFNKGYEGVREEKKRQDENREKRAKGIFRLFLSKDGDETTVRFLTTEPITFYEHTVKVVRSGKESYDNVLCIGDDCELCESGDKPSFKGAFLVWDNREFTAKDAKGKEVTVKGSVKLYVQGTKVLSQLDRLATKYGLADREFTVVRCGKGTQTSYVIEKGDELDKLSRKEVENMLPEKLREMYNGTDESLYKIIREALASSLEEEKSSTSNSRTDDEEDEYDNRKNLVGVEDEEAPKKTNTTSRPKIGGSIKYKFKKN